MASPNWLSNMSDRKAVELVTKWTAGHDCPCYFNKEFVMSVASGLKRYGKLTKKQRDAMNNIILKWHIRPKQRTVVEPKETTDDDECHLVWPVKS
jgi:hypothetical protein